MEEEIDGLLDQFDEEVTNGNQAIFHLLEVVRREVVRLYNISVVASGARDFRFLLETLCDTFSTTILPFTESATTVCTQFLKNTDQAVDSASAKAILNEIAGDVRNIPQAMLQ